MAVHENHRSLASILCSGPGQPTKQNNRLKFIEYNFPLLAMALRHHPDPQGHKNFSFLRTCTFSDVSSFHHLDHLDPDLHRSVYVCASLFDILTKHGIACHVPNLIGCMILRCVTSTYFLFVIDFSIKTKSLLTPNCYNALLDALVTTGLLFGMKRVYTEMLDVASPGVHTLNTMVSAYSRHGYMVESNQFVCKMIQSGLALNISTFTSLIMGYSITNYVDAALKVFHKNMVELRCVPYFKCYQHLILGFCFAKKLELAHRLLVQMQRQEIAPSWIVFDKIVNCCCELKKYGEAAQVVDHMISSGVYTPTLKDCRTLICGLYEEGKKERATAVFHKLLQCGEYYDNEIAWKILVGGLRKKKGLAEEFSHLFHAMQISGCHLSPQTLFMLNQGLQRKTQCA